MRSTRVYLWHYVSYVNVGTGNARFASHTLNVRIVILIYNSLHHDAKVERNTILVLRREIRSSF
jgi:hypothetical protein